MEGHRSKHFLNLMRKYKQSGGKKLGNVRPHLPLDNLMSKIRLARIILPQKTVLQTCCSRKICLGPTLWVVERVNQLTYLKLHSGMF